MRKEVKIGFAIGGVLLAVLVVYVLVVSGGEKQQPVTLVTTDAQSQTQNPSADKPVVEQKDKSAALPDKPAADKAAEKQTDPFQSPAHDKVADNWGTILNTGKMTPLISQTPTVDSKTAAAPIAQVGDPTPVTPNTPVSVGNISSPLSPSTQPASPQRTHVVQAGETFSSIAAAAYGNSAYYPHLLRANPNIDPHKLKAGMTIVIPPVGDVRADQKTATDAASSSTTDTKFDSKTEYRVAAGDSLYKIALNLYGKADMAEKIYDLNKSTIGEDHAKLKVNMVLKLPSPPTVVASH